MEISLENYSAPEPEPLTNWSDVLAMRFRELGDFDDHESLEKLEVDSYKLEMTSDLLKELFEDEQENAMDETGPSQVEILSHLTQ